GFETEFERERRMIFGVAKNVLSHPFAFLKYERKTGFFATKAALGYLAGKGSGVPAMDRADIRLLRAWRNASP
ncbi:MAG: hypothetical protein ACP5T1_07390, partial [Thermoplasmata archaeon]